MKMGMEMDQYWPQHKVYLYGTCALFPEKINDRMLGADHLGNYIERFPLLTDDNQVKALKKYETRKMFKVEVLETRRSRELSALDVLEMLNPDSLMDDKHKYKFRITNINQGKFRANLVEYLKKFSEDELTTEFLPVKPESPEVLIGRLHAFTNKAHRKRPKVTLYDIWPNANDRNVLLNPFWELIFSSELIFDDVKILDIGQSPLLAKEVGSEKNKSLPYAEIESHKKTQPAKPEPPTAPTNAVGLQPESEEKLQTITVGMNKKGDVYAKLSNREKYLIKSLRVDSGAYNFMNHVLGHQDKDIGRGIIQTKVDGCSSAKKMTDLVGRCGFTKELLSLKAEFFGGTTEKNVYFVAHANLKDSQIKLVKQLEKVIS